MGERMNGYCPRCGRMVSGDYDSGVFATDTHECQGKARIGHPTPPKTGRGVGPEVEKPIELLQEHSDWAAAIENALFELNTIFDKRWASTEWCYDLAVQMTSFYAARDWARLADTIDEIHKRWYNAH